MALILEHASHTYGAGTAFAVEALQPVDFQVAPGRLAVVLGPTGSGKSTLLRLAAGLIGPTSGRVVMDGTTLDGPAAGIEGGVGFVFQSPETQLFAETVLEDVAFGPANQGLDPSVARDRARDALVSVGLDPDAFSARSPFALSGGEARRVALAGVLAMRPRYLLLDEPTAGLDGSGRDAVLEAIETVRPITGIVVVTHDAEEFLGRADIALLLAGGAAAFYGPAAELIEDPSLLDATGLRAPEILRALASARDSGLFVPEMSLDPVRAAELLADALGQEPGV